MALAEPADLWELDEDASGAEEEAWEPVLVVAERRSEKQSVRAHDARNDLEVEFNVLAEELMGAAAMVSSTRRLTRHPAYIGILSLGEPVIPLILSRLSEPRGRPAWLTLLGSLTAFQPGAGRETVEEAASDWISWGKRQGHVM